MGIQPIRKIITPEIPDKLYFRIGDVARLCEVPAYVLRFWETEFPLLKPNKGGTGQRLYRKRDVEMALRIKSLLYDQGYTIPGARQVFKNETKAREVAATEAFTPVSPAAENFAPQFAPAQDAAPNALSDPGAEMRRNVQLLALRQEMQLLLNMLGAPRSSQPDPGSRAKPLRPRLVLEPKAEFKPEFRPEAEPRPAATRPDTLRLVREPEPQPQGDLFAGQ